MVLEKIKRLLDLKNCKSDAHPTNPTHNIDSTRVSLYKHFVFPQIFRKHSRRAPEEDFSSVRKEKFVYERNGSYLNDEFLSEATRR